MQTYNKRAGSCPGLPTMDTGRETAWRFRLRRIAEFNLARNRGGQRGYIAPTKTGYWQGHWYEYRKDDAGEERRVHRTKILGSRATMRKSEAQQLLLSLIAGAGYEDDRAAASKRQGVTPDATFGWFMRERYWRLKESTWRRKTRDLNHYTFEQLLAPRWGAIPLRAIDKVDVQEWLGQLAGKYSRSTVHQCRVYLRAICEEAIEQGYLDRNPCRKLAMPAAARKPDKSVLNAEQVAAIARELGSFRDRLIFRLFVVCGFRRQELFALRWDDLDGRSLRIDETIERSAVVEETKTHGSRALVGISAGLADELAAWRRETEYHQSRDFLFASSVGTHLAPENWIRHALKPAARRAGVERINYQILRRTFATLAPSAGISLKHISTQLRHSTILITGDCYMQPVERDILEGLDALDQVYREAGRNAAA